MFAERYTLIHDVDFFLLRYFWDWVVENARHLGLFIGNGLHCELTHIHIMINLNLKFPIQVALTYDKKQTSVPQQSGDNSRLSTVLKWLHGLGLSKYEDIFVREEIDWAALQWLTDEVCFLKVYCMKL